MKISITVLAAAFVMILAVGSVRANDDKPTTAPAAAPPDLCKGVIDPYDAVAERGRFLEAAGVTNELDANSFQANRGKKNAFVRDFDRWEEILKFDQNHNGTIDWFEAEAYRQDLRKKVLALFADKNGRLKGKDRDAANQALQDGKVFELAAAGSASRPFDGPVTIQSGSSSIAASKPVVFQLGNGKWPSTAERMAKAIELSDEQKDQLDAIDAAQKKAINDYDADHKDKMEAAMKATMEALQSGDKDALAKAQKDSQALWAPKMEIFQKAAADAMAVLTAEQKVQWLDQTLLTSIKTWYAKADMTEEQWQKMQESFVPMARGFDGNYTVLSNGIQAKIAAVLTDEQRSKWVDEFVLAQVKKRYDGIGVTDEQWQTIKDAALARMIDPNESSTTTAAAWRDIEKALTPEQREAATKPPAFK